MKDFTTLFVRTSDALKTGLWWAKDTTGHADSTYKVFKEAKGGKELQWVADLNKYGNFIDGKHKKFYRYSNKN